MQRVRNGIYTAAVPSELRWVRYVSLPVVILLWQIACMTTDVDSALVPSPVDVALSLWHALQDGSLIADVLWSVSRVVVGYFLGAALGILVGLITARYALMREALLPIMQALRPIPPIAIVPLTILWFGLTEWSKYFLIAWGVFFVVWIATFMGVQRIDALLLRAAQSLGVPEHKMMREVLFPGALPYIAVGLRTSVTIAFYSLVAAEVAGAFAGIAYRVSVSHQNMQTGLMIGALLVLGLVSALADKLFEFVIKRIIFWK